MEANKVLEEHIQDLLVVRDVIASYRYLSRSGSTGRHNTLEAYIGEYPDTALLALFRMLRAPPLLTYLLKLVGKSIGIKKQ